MTLKQLKEKHTKAEEQGTDMAGVGILILARDRRTGVVKKRNKRYRVPG